MFGRIYFGAGLWLCYINLLLVDYYVREQTFIHNSLPQINDGWCSAAVSVRMQINEMNPFSLDDI